MFEDLTESPREVVARSLWVNGVLASILGNTAALHTAWPHADVLTVVSLVVAATGALMDSGHGQDWPEGGSA